MYNAEKWLKHNLNVLRYEQGGFSILHLKELKWPLWLFPIPIIQFPASEKILYSGLRFSVSQAIITLSIVHYPKAMENHPLLSVILQSIERPLKE